MAGSLAEVRPDMDFDEPEDVFEKLAALGEPRAEFMVGSRVLLRNLILAPMLVLAGLAIEFIVFRFIGHSFELIMLGIGLVITGVMLVVRAYRNRGLRVLVFAEGLVRVRGEEGQAMFWEEVDTLWRKKTEGHWEVLWKGSLSYLVQRADSTLTRTRKEPHWISVKSGSTSAASAPTRASWPGGKSRRLSSTRIRP